MRDFRKLNIWVESIELVTKIYQLTLGFPDSEKFGLISQMRRASVSIPSNIAEGASRSSQLEFKRYLEMALGSSFELESQLLISEKLSFIGNEKLIEVVNELTGLQKQISNLIAKIKTEIKIQANG